MQKSLTYVLRTFSANIKVASGQHRYFEGHLFFFWADKWKAKGAYSRSFFSLIFCLAFFIAASQVREYSFDHITTTEDLSQNSALCMLQDSNGFMWIGTQEGLDCYDGVGFLHFANNINDPTSISPGFTKALYEDPKSATLWVATEFGLNRFDLKRNYDLIANRIQGNKIEAGINVLSGDNDGNVWAATSKHIYRIYQNNVSLVSATGAIAEDFSNCVITDLIVDKIHKKGIIATSKGLYDLDIQRNEITGRLKIEGLNEKNNVTKISQDKTDLIVALDKIGVYIIDIRNYLETGRVNTPVKIKAPLFYSIQGQSKKNIENCTSILVDFDDNLWIGAAYQGLFKFRKSFDSGQHFTRVFNLESSLTSTLISSLYQSRDGTVWIGTNGGGINKLVKNRPHFQRYFNGLNGKGLTPNNDVWCIYKLNEDDILLGTDGNGLISTSISTGYTQIYKNSGDIKSRIVRSIAGKGNKILIGTKAGLYLVPTNNLNNYERAPKLTECPVLSIAVMDSLTIVGTSQNGFILLNADFKMIGQYLCNDSIPVTVNSFCFSAEDGYLYVNTNRGIYCFEIARNSLAQKKVILRGIDISSVVVLGSSIWASTINNGLWAIDRHTFEINKHFTKKNGLRDNVLYGMLSDANYRLWFSTNKGISVYNTKDSTFNHYSRDYGLQHDEFNLGAFYVDSQKYPNTLFFGGVNGLNSIFWDSDDRPVKEDYKFVLLENGTLFVKSSIDSQFKQNNFLLEVDPSLISTSIGIRLFGYADPSNNKYRFRLNDSAWGIERSTREPIIISRLQLHEFRYNILEIMVRSSNGTWERLKPVKIWLPFDIRSEFSFSSFWVFTLCLFIIVCLSAFLWLRRKTVRQLKVERIKLNENQSLLEENQILIESKNKELLQQKLSLENLTKALQKQNKQLVEKDSEVAKVVRNLQKDTSELEMLQVLINKISSVNTTDALIKMSFKHWTDPKTFGFDYIIFSEVNYYSEAVEVQQSMSINPLIEPHKWKEKARQFSLASNDVMAVCIKEDKTIEVSGKEIFNVESATLDPKVFEAFDHINLHRLFIPIRPILSADLEDLAGDTLGLFEVGNYKKEAGRFDENWIIKLRLYADSFAQSLKRLKNVQTDSEIRKIFDESEIDSRDNHLEYLFLIVKKACQFMHADCGGIILNSADPTTINSEDVRIVFTSESCEGLGVSINTGMFLFESLKTGNVTAVNKKFKSERLLSCLSYPIRYDNKIIGSIEIISRKAGFFDERWIVIANKLFKDVGAVFMEKKFHFALANLVSHGNMPLEPNEGIKQVIRSIQDFFLTEFVSVWVRDYTKDNIEFGFMMASESLTRAFPRYGKSNINLPANLPVFSPFALEQVDMSLFKSLLNDLRNECQVKSVIHVPLMLDIQQYGFINIYSRRHIDGDLFIQSKQFLELIAGKTAVEFISAKMMLKFSDISKFLVDKDLDSVLQQITDGAREILNSEPVIVFRCDAKGKILYEKTILSGFIKDRKTIKEGRTSSFIEYSISNGVERFYKSETDLPKEYELVSKVGSKIIENFWRREDIKSLAVMPLKQDNKIIGVMCFNYRLKQEFPIYAQKLIVAFSSLATTAIKNIENVSIIKEQAAALKVKNEQVQFEYEEVYRKMLDMLPVANATALAEVIRAVNHDIRNNLLKIEVSLSEIKTSQLKNSPEKGRLEDVSSTIAGDIRNTTSLIALFEPDSFSISVEDIAEIANKVRELFAGHMKRSNHGINFYVDVVSKDMPLIMCSKAELSMIIYNLVTNARNAINEKWNKLGRKTKLPQGFIKVELGYDTSDRFYFLSVEDDGIGIDNSILQKIYEPGFTTRIDEGLGIGLYFVKTTIENVYGGTIKCKSYVNRGTKFELKFRQHVK